MTKVLFLSTVYFGSTFTPMDYYGLKTLDSVKESKWYAICKSSTTRTFL